MPDVALSLLVLKTPQMERLRAFYGALGVELTEERHGGGPRHYAGRVGSTVLEIYPLSEDDAAADATTRLGFTVDTLPELLDTLQALGVPVVAPPRATEWGERAVARDPDGRTVELYSR